MWIGVRRVDRRVGVVAVGRSVGTVVWLLLDHNNVWLWFSDSLSRGDLRGGGHLCGGADWAGGGEGSRSEVPGWSPEPGPLYGGMDHGPVQGQVGVPGRGTSIGRSRHTVHSTGSRSGQSRGAGLSPQWGRSRVLLQI